MITGDRVTETAAITAVTISIAEASARNHVNFPIVPIFLLVENRTRSRRRACLDKPSFIKWFPLCSVCILSKRKISVVVLRRLYYRSRFWLGRSRFFRSATKQFEFVSPDRCSVSLDPVFLVFFCLQLSG